MLLNLCFLFLFINSTQMVQMRNFLDFLKASKSVLQILTKSKNIHIVLGNESCDLDSTVSALLLGYFLSKQKFDHTVIPILNVSQEKFLLRTENCYVLKQAGVPFEDLVFRNEIDLEDILNKTNVKVSLVDHHVLSKNDEILQKYVTQIFDHRPVDSSCEWDKDKVSVRIEHVGSCSTLIADEILKSNREILTKPLAFLLYQTIIYDTIALKLEHGKAKDLDVNIGSTLEETFNFTEDRQTLFDKLWAVHNDVSNLTAQQLLFKDLKTVEGIHIPGLPMLVEDYLKINGAHNAIVNFASENKVTCILLVGLDASKQTVRRDIGIYSKFKDDKLKSALLHVFNTSTEFDFQFEKRTSLYEDVSLLHAHNTKLSRKQLVPLVKVAWKNFLEK